MESVVIGIIIAIAVGIISFVWQSDFYSKPQKWIISIFIVFPPAMVGLLIFFSIYNNVAPSIKQKTKENITNISELLKENKSGKAIDKLQKLNSLKKDGVISEEEFDRLSKKIKQDLMQ